MNGMCFPMVKVVTIKEIFQDFYDLFLNKKIKYLLFFKTMSSAFAKKI